MFKKNLLVICNNFPDRNDCLSGGIFVKEQVNYLKKYFNTINVISPVAFGLDRYRKIKYENYQFDNVRVFFPKYINNPLFWHYRKSWWIFFEARALLSFIRKNDIQFDLIHAHFTWPSGAVAVKLKENLGIPVVITEHSSRTFSDAVSKKDPLMINTWHKADAIIRVRKGDLSQFIKLNIQPKKIFFIPNGYNEEKFYPQNYELSRNTLGLPVNKKIILNVANLYSEIKGHKYLIDAMAEVIRKSNNVIAIIVGSGKLKAEIQNQINGLGLNDFVILVGEKPHNEISLWMNACDIFVLPSLIESFGIVQIEAMACGKPVVATRNGASEEIIISNKYGLLVNPADPKDLAEKVLMVLDREWDRETIFKYVESYKWKNIIVEILRIYERTLKQNEKSE